VKFQKYFLNIFFGLFAGIEGGLCLVDWTALMRPLSLSIITNAICILMYYGKMVLLTETPNTTFEFLSSDSARLYSWFTLQCGAFLLAEPTATHNSAPLDLLPDFADSASVSAFSQSTVLLSSPFLSLALIKGV
jgi:hypothetical protein